MTLKNRFQQFIQNDWIIGLFLFGIFMLTNGYTYGWDDQHLELPLLKNLIDPALFAGDYYVESLKINFTSYLYPILARFITVAQIPLAYFVLYCISRYFMLFWTYKIWEHLSKRKLTGILSTLTMIILYRVDEILYRTFSHQEFALAIVFAGIYYFYKERFYLAAILLGIAANFHAIYGLFPMVYITIYLLFAWKKHGFKTLITSGILFVVSIIPLLIWMVQKHNNPANTITDPHIYDGWLELYRMAAPQNFTFLSHSLQEVGSNLKVFLRTTQGFSILIALFCLNIFQNKRFQQDTKSHVIIYTGTVFLIATYFFIYVVPHRFVINLNFSRHSQFMLFVLLGYTTMLLCEIVEKKKWLLAFFSVLLFTLFRSGHYLPTFAGLGLLFILNLVTRGQEENSARRNIIITLFAAGLILCLAGIWHQYSIYILSPSSLISIYSVIGLLMVIYLLHFFLKSQKQEAVLRKIFIIIPFLIFTINYTYYHHRHLRIERTGTGFWQMQRDWFDMQNYVRENTPKNALLLVPYNMEMGGFRIFSERKIICSYRDHGIIGFDYKAAMEWQRRVKDIEPFKTFVSDSIKPAILNAIFVYRVNYIVFMRYMAPKESNDMLELLYKNDVFALYKVIKNPVQD